MNPDIIENVERAHEEERKSQELSIDIEKAFNGFIITILGVRYIADDAYGVARIIENEMREKM